MQTLTLEVTQDHIDRLCKAKKPVLGIAELIWNSVDADSTEVAARVNRNALSSIDTIDVADKRLCQAKFTLPPPDYSIANGNFI